MRAPSIFARGGGVLSPAGRTLFRDVGDGGSGAVTAIEPSGPAVEVKRLANGATVVWVDPQEGVSPTAVVSIWLRNGSRVPEAWDAEGLAHFLEHMTFKGTRRRTKGQIEAYTEKLGAHLNAFTSKEYTAFYGNCLREDASSIFNLLTEMVLDASYDTEAVVSEIDTILRESAEVNLIPEEVLLDKVHSQVYGLDAALGQPILGSDERIKRTTKTQIDSFRHQVIRPENLMVILVTDAEKVVRQAIQRFERLPSQTQPQPQPQPQTQYQTLTDQASQASLNGQVPAPTFKSGCELHIQMVPDLYVSAPVFYIAWTVPGVSWDSPDFWKVVLLRLLFRRWEEQRVSRLQRPAAASSVQGSAAKVPSSLEKVADFNTSNTFDVFYRDCGLFGVFQLIAPDCETGLMDELTTELVLTEERSGVSEGGGVAGDGREGVAGQKNVYEKKHIRERIQEFIRKSGEAIEEDCRRCAREMDQGQLEHAKEAALILLGSSENGSLSLSEEVGREVLANGAFESFESMAAKVRNVTLTEMQAFAQNLFAPNKPSAITALLRIPSAAAT